MAPARTTLRAATSHRLFQLDVARAFAGGLAVAVSRLHSCGYVHGDLHLRNVLVQLPSSLDQLSIEQFYTKYGFPEEEPIVRRDGKPLSPHVPEKAVIPFSGFDFDNAEKCTVADARVILSDFGESFSVSKGPSRLGKDCHTPLPMQPPEARFEPDTPLSYSADIWSLAVALWEIVAIKGFVSADFATADEVLGYYIDVIGPLPPAWQNMWVKEYAVAFDDSGERRNLESRLWSSLEEAFDLGIQKYWMQDGVGHFDDEEKMTFLDLIRRMVVFRTEERISIQQVLESEWMVRWGAS